MIPGLVVGRVTRDRHVRMLIRSCFLATLRYSLFSAGFETLRRILRIGMGGTLTYRDDILLMAPKDLERFVHRWVATDLPRVISSRMD
ncbi:hypothetical protein CDO26_35385 (plasmid) [Sinorhizobium meliloti]|nr:hypothetical protein CDO26_35385 [Sinorhizobium meliloti]